MEPEPLGSGRDRGGDWGVFLNQIQRSSPRLLYFREMKEKVSQHTPVRTHVYIYTRVYAHTSPTRKLKKTTSDSTLLKSLKIFVL